MRTRQPRAVTAADPTTTRAYDTTRRPSRVRLLARTVVAIAAFCAMGDIAGAQNTQDDGVYHKNVEIEVFNDCYQDNDDGTMTSYFGYELTKPSTVHLTAGSKYNFLTEVAENSGQPSSFRKGRHPLILSITYPSSGAVPVWTLNAKQVRADASEELCKEAASVPEFPVALVAPAIVLLAFGIWFRRNKSDPLAAS